MGCCHLETVTGPDAGIGGLLFLLESAGQPASEQKKRYRPTDHVAIIRVNGTPVIRF